MKQLFLTLSTATIVMAGLAVWPDITDEDGHLSRPTPKDWREKNWGQWCRNFSKHLHVQCPEASLFHEYNCCGEHGTDCCFSIQGWLIVIGSISAVTTSMIFIFYFLLKLQIICVESVYPPKTITLK